jgi:hypothetical protein
MTASWQRQLGREADKIEDSEALSLSAGPTMATCSDLRLSMWHRLNTLLMHTQMVRSPFATGKKLPQPCLAQGHQVGCSYLIGIHPQ